MYFRTNVSIKSVIAAVVASLFLYTGYFVAYAVIPQFSVGQTINPGCGPTDPTCTVAPLSIGDYIKNSTPGSVLFADSVGLLGQDNDNFHWNATQARLGVGTATPLARVHVEGDTHTSLDPLIVTVDGMERFRISTTEIRFFDAYTFPKDSGALNQVLTTDGGGTLSWQNIPQPLIGSTTSIGAETWLGESAGSNNASTVDTVFVGATTGRGAVSAKKASFFGAQAGVDAVFASYSSFFGFSAGLNATNARNAIFIGTSAGQNDTVDNTTGSSSILIGNNTNTGGYSNSIALGTGAVNTQSNQFMIAPLYTQFNMRGVNWTLPDAQGGAGQVLTNDGNGNLSWTTVSGGGTGLIGSTSGITNTFPAAGVGETWLGNLAGSAASVIGTVFVGLSTGSNATNADYSNFIGFYSGQNASGAQQSNFMGFRAGIDATNAAASNFIGADAGNTATGATLSNFVGAGAGQYATYASYSNFFGVLSGKDAINANHSNFIGYNSGSNAPNAANSIFIGTSAGQNDTVDNTTGSSSILIGNNTNTGGYSNSIALGTGAVNTQSNQFMVGSTTNPVNEMRINGGGSTQCTITTGTGVACTSDERMKTEITELKEVLPLLQKVETVTYLWKDLPNTPVQVGFIAQNLEKSFPQLVATDSDGYKSVYYSQMTPILTKAIQELNLKIDLIALSSGISTSTLYASIADSVKKILSETKDLVVENISAVSATFKEIHTQFVSSDKINTKELCVDDICVTREQFKQLLNQQAALSVGGGGSVHETPQTETPQTDSAVVPATESIEEATLIQQNVDTPVSEQPTKE